MDIFRVKSDSTIKVGSIKLNEKNLKSEAELILALNDNMKDLENGMYCVHPENTLFARFKLDNNIIEKLERWSENTGIVMPCWNHFEKI